MTSPSDYGGPVWFCGPTLPQSEPRREVTEAEQAYVENFLAEIKGLCAKYNLTIASLDEWGIAVVEGSDKNGFAFCYEIRRITAQEVEGLRWD